MVPQRTVVVRILLAWVMSAAGWAVGPTQAQAQAQATGSVIFIHPDGTSAAHWQACRALYAGPDNDLNWDKLPAIAVYREHISDSLTATSNAGGTIHAYGVKVPASSYGTDGGKAILDAQNRSLSVAHQALAAGLGVGVVNSGTNTEPGTGCFLASVTNRSNHDEIARQLVHSGAQVILGGGEQYFLPKGVAGRHGPGMREDQVNLVEEAAQLGYQVVYTREELAALPGDTGKVLGLFAANHTFNDQSEEKLREKNLPEYSPQAPTVAEMTTAALKVLQRKGTPFFLMVEEEGTDNFGNVNNASGSLHALQRADEAIGVARQYLAEHPQTLLITAADSDAGGMKMIGLRHQPDKPLEKLPATDKNGAPLDGPQGSGSLPFVAKPDRQGKAMPFAITWATLNDCSGGVLVRGEGLHADQIRGSFDNTRIAHLMRQTLLGK